MKDPKYLDEAFSQITEEMLQTFINKHKDYGKGNILDWYRRLRSDCCPSSKKLV